MKPLPLSTGDKNLLALLEQGLNAKQIAVRLNRSHGTIRSRLSRLYIRLGVDNRMAAVEWWKLKSMEPAVTRAVSACLPPQPMYRLSRNYEFGMAALSHGLLTALGAMSLFLGVTSAQWQTSREVDSEATITFELMRVLWEGFLKGELEGTAAAWQSMDPDIRPYAGRIVTVLILLVLKRFPEASDLAVGLTSEDKRLFIATWAWLAATPSDNARGLDALAVELPLFHPLRHFALATLFYGAQRRGEQRRAIDAANALFVEAELVRNHLACEGRWQFTPLVTDYGRLSERLLPLLRVEGTGPAGGLGRYLHRDQSDLGDSQKTPGMP